MTLEEFIEFVRAEEKAGRIRFEGAEVTDYDLMVMMAVARIGERGGYPFDTTPAKIYEECRKLGEYANKLLEEAET